MPLSSRAAPAPRAPVVHRRYWVPAGSVKLGMHVAELDRPWLDTPFMLQGFRVSSPRQIEVLQKFCMQVVVDVEQSSPDARPLILERGEPVSDQTPACALADAGGQHRPLPPVSTADAASARGTSSQDTASSIAPSTPTAPSVRTVRDERAHTPAAAPVAARTAARGRPLAPARHADPSAPAASAAAIPVRNGATADRTGFWDWLKSLLFGRPGPAPLQAARSLPPDLEREIRATLPGDVELQDWRETRSIESELPRARAALERSERVLDDVFQDLEGGRLPAVDTVRGAMDMVVASMAENPNAMLWVSHLRQRSQRNYRHALRVSLYMVALGRKLGFPRPQLVELGMIGLLADVGMTRVPREILDKRGLLSPEEFDEVRRHVATGLELLSEATGLSEDVLKGIAQHHERLDGSGYPLGLAGSAISVYGRMAAIADCFAALTSERPYAPAMTPHQALMSLFQWSKSGFHAPLVEQFVQSIGLFPVGSLIELSTGEVAVVLAHNRIRRLEPRVLLLTSADKRPLRDPVEFDLMSQERTEDKAAVFIVKGLPSGSYGLSASDYYADATAEECTTC